MTIPGLTRLLYAVPLGLMVACGGSDHTVTTPAQTTGNGSAVTPGPFAFDAAPGATGATGAEAVGTSPNTAPPVVGISGAAAGVDFGSSVSNNLSAGDCAFLAGASVFADDPARTFLGRIVGRFDSQSIFNTFGAYGSELSRMSIWNSFSPYGSPDSPFSAFNSASFTPPRIISAGGVFLAFLSENRTIRPRVSPGALRAVCTPLF